MSDLELISRCHEGNIDAVRQILADNANINAYINEDSPLLASVRKNNTRLLTALLEAGADTTRVYRDRMTTLMIASRGGYLEVVRCLLQYQPAALIDARDRYGCTALFIALQDDKLDVASALLDAGADATIARNDGTTTLMACTDVATARRLLELGVDIHANIEGRDALQLACSRGKEELACFLLASGANRYTCEHGNTPLHYACGGGHARLVALLLRQDGLPGGDELQRRRWLHALNNFRQTALHLAVRGGSVGCVQALVDAGFDVNTKDGMRRAPALHFAKDVEIARILLDAGAKDIKNSTGQTATALACGDPYHVDVLRLLLQRFPASESQDIQYLFIAVRAGNLEAVRALVAARPPGFVNVQDTDGRTALFIRENEGMMRLLLELGADPRILTTKTKTLLMTISCHACVRLLLEAAPDLVNKRDSRGWTAMMHMSYHNDRYDALEELFRYCEEHGIDAEVNSKDINGDTALRMAMYKGNLRTVKLLLEKGGRVLDYGDDDNITMLMMPFSDTTRHMGLRPAKSGAKQDANASACLTAVLDAVLLRGRVGDTVAKL